MSEEVKKYILSKNNKVSEKKVSLEDFIEYIKIYEDMGIQDGAEHNTTGSIVHKEMIKDV